MRMISHALVAAAIAVMIGLGIWQIQRLAWKEGLIASYEAAADLAPVAYPVIVPGNPPLYRRSGLDCLEVVGWRDQAGANRNQQSGYAHVAECRTGAEGPGAAVEIGWSLDPNAGHEWQGGAVSGIIGPDEKYGFRLVADRGQAGLEPSAQPSPQAMTNNHLAYAIQWFLFALIAAVIYTLALRKRAREDADA